jgi:hypothetical protein
MDHWQQFWVRFFFQLSTILPWFAASIAAVIAVSLTPFGRALTRYLRESNRGQAVPPGPEDALAALRADSAEVLERLDFLERVIAQKQPPPERQALASPEVPRPANPPVARIRTPV